MAFVGRKKDYEYKDVIKGRVWVFPDYVDTDAISPGQYLDDLKATLEHTCETINKDFPKNVKEGDIIIGGKNFGCGSSRETAPVILQEKGISAIVAESFARIFYRSSFARALALLEADNISQQFSNGDMIEINISEAKIKNLTTNKEFNGNKIDEILLDLLKIGGLEKKLLKELRDS